ncbi:unnamed protein product, partial [Discosporangium mesarthrocarpum]
AGEVAGDYSEDWTKTFDMKLVVVMVAWLIINIVITHFTKPELFHNLEFWVIQ